MLPYKVLLERLDIASVRELEEIIIDCMYQGLLKGKLDQKKERLEVASAVARDISTQDVQLMIKQLADWLVLMLS